MDSEQICKKLHDINFGSGGIVRPEMECNAEEYTFDKLICDDSRRDGQGNWIKRCHKYPEGQCYCTECNKINPLTADENDAAYRFTGITHGAHTFDFLDAHGEPHNSVSTWSKEPVLFVFENPGSVNSGNYGNGVDAPAELPSTVDRLPCKWWYWINGQDDEKYKDSFIYPNWFVQKEYGWMIYSVIRTFEIANAYVTNMVKCGIGNLNSYLTTDKYNSEIAKTCISEQLKREINALRDENSDKHVTIFAFGQNVYDTLVQFKDALGKCEIYMLPHPANRLANDYRKYVLFGKILRGLLKHDFYHGVAPPDFCKILCDDNDDKKGNSAPNVLTKNALKEYLSKYLKQNSGFEESAKYSDDKKFTYQIGADSFGLKVVFRQYKVDDKDYAASWACYYPETGDIYLYKGKDTKIKRADVFVDSDHTAYEVYNQIEAFAKHLKKQIPGLNDCYAVTKLDEKQY